MTQATFQDRVVEFFTLREARRENAAVPEETRSTAYRGLRIAFQKRAGAETLWPRGSTAEALRLARDAVEGVTASLSSFPPDSRPPWFPRAEALAAAATKTLADARLPSLEAETEPSHEETFRTLVDSLIAIEDLAGPSLATPGELVRVRNVRAATTAFGVVLLVAALALVLRRPPFAKATASGQHSTASSAEKAFDGDIATAWSLPDRVAEGWIDLELSKPRPIHVVHILPSNPPYNDRDIKDARIDAVLDDVIVKSLDVTFPEPTGTAPSWNDVVLDAPKCDHLHITTKSNYRLGLGIAEIELR